MKFCYVRIGKTARIDGIRRNVAHEYFNGSGTIPFIPWNSNKGNYIYVYISTTSSAAYTDYRSSGKLICETAASGTVPIHTKKYLEC